MVKSTKEPCFLPQNRYGAGSNADRQQVGIKLIEGKPTPASEESIVAVNVFRSYSLRSRPLIHGVEVVDTVQVDLYKSTSRSPGAADLNQPSPGGAFF